MYIKRIRLEKCLRFRTSGHEIIDITFEHPHHVILGTNSSGKTSLLRECTPLPAVKTDYGLGGSKSLWFTDHDKDYLAISDFSKESPSYSLCCESTGHWICQNVNQSTYRLSLFELLSWTPFHAKLLLGFEFHQFSTAERRELFNLLNGPEVEQAWLVYKYLQKQSRDQKAQLSYLDNQLAKADQRLKDYTSTHGNLEKQSAQLKDHIQSLTLQRVRHPLSAEELRRAIATNLAQQQKIQSDLQENEHKRQSHLQENPEHSDWDINSITEELDRISKREQYLRSVIEEQRRQYEELNRHELVPAANIRPLNDIDRDLRQVNNELDVLLNSVGDYTPQDKRRIKQALMEYQENLLSELSDMQRFDLVAFRQNYAVYQTGMALIQQKRLQIKQQLATKEDLTTASRDVVCPACDHQWEDNPHARRIEAISQDIQTTEQEIKNVLNNWDGWSSDHVEIGLMHVETHERLISWCQQYQSLLPSGMGDTISSYIKYIEANPKEPCQWLQTSLNHENDLEAIEERRRVQRSLLTEKAMSSGEGAIIRATLAKLDESLPEHQTSLENTIRLKTLLKGYRVLLDKDIQLNQQLTGLIRTEGDQQRMLVAVLEEEQKAHVIKQAMDELHEIESKLHDFKNAEQLKITYQVEHHRLKKLHEVNLNIQSQLSPVDGLLASALVGSINPLLDEANNLLRDIWTYPLKFLPYKHDEELELKYKLPMCLNDEVLLNDLAEGSASIVEVGNFALRYAILKRLGIVGYPVYLDEFGRTMDYIHRSEAYRAIYSRLTQGGFSQILMVTHHPDVYSGLEVGRTVLCAKNIENDR